MRVLHITAEALRGGCEKNCYLFIKGSPIHTHEVLVLGKKGPMSEDWNELNVELNHLDILKINLIRFWIGLRKFMTSRNYDTVICWSTVRLPLQLNCIGNRAVFIKVYLGNPVNESYHSLKDRILELIFPTQKHKVTLMACSRYVKQSHDDTPYFNQFAVNVSLNPVELPTRRVIRNTIEGEFHLGMVARLDPIKDHHTVIKGFQVVQAKIGHAKLHLVGNGVLRNELEKLVIRLGIQNAVFFYGDVRDVYEHLRKWDIFVYATTPMEGLGSVVEEAMANGLPCVLSDLPMLREIAPLQDLVAWFKQGDSCDMAEQVIEIYQDQVRKEQLGELAYQHAQIHFSAERFVNDYLIGAGELKK